ncbi:hypothetical protein CDL12_15742 [Handroanthus impetiginosus]|uniref:Kelch repeat-containing protein n=1 Tax=Handroanthus impetiginosus TaxID=429701 RepID=A0A2G9H297_9LAMI|nr:hypothetical protein CDL12_15742 [Handroanthus impetiginosus]
MVPGRGKWVKLDQKGTGPGARSSRAVAVVGQKVYAFGGEFTPRVPVDNHLYVFDLNDQTWSVADAKGDIPPPRVGVTMASIGETIYVFGGRDATHKELNGLSSFDTYHSMTVDERRVYIFGGCGNAGRLNDLWAYDIVDQKWIKFPLPGENCKPRGGLGLAAVNGKFWVVYGFSGVELDDVHYFDSNEGKWDQVETSGEKPTARSVFTTVAVGKYVFIYVNFPGEVFALNTETLVWKRWEDGLGSDSNYHPGPRGWCAFAGGQRDGQEGLLVYGGNSLSNDRLDDIYFFTP